VDAGFEHLIRVLGLCQLPSDLWSEDDHMALREAREYVQGRMGDGREGKSEKEGAGVVGTRSGARSQPPAGSSEEEKHVVKERASDLGKVDE